MIKLAFVYKEEAASKWSNCFYVNVINNHKIVCYEFALSLPFSSRIFHLKGSRSLAGVQAAML